MSEVWKSDKCPNKKAKILPQEICIEWFDTFSSKHNAIFLNKQDAISLAEWILEKCKPKSATKAATDVLKKLLAMSQDEFLCELDKHEHGELADIIGYALDPSYFDRKGDKNEKK
jgi:hypothetical protein